MFLRATPPKACATRPAGISFLCPAGRTLFRRFPSPVPRPGAYPLRSGLHLSCFSVMSTMAAFFSRRLIIVDNDSFQELSMELLTVGKLRELLRYEPSTGNFYWKKEGGDKKPAGHTTNGYVRISLGRFGVHYAHRLAWLYMQGSFPGMFIDHKNGIRKDNRWSNLRQASCRQNNWNSRRPRNNSTGKKGVTVYRGKFRAQISVRGRRKWLGDFETLGLAAEAYLRASKAEFGPFARAG